MLLECSGISKRFGGVHAVAEVDLAIAPQQVFGLIGPNGAGKTTLVNLISGHLRVDSGAIRFAGADVTGLAPHTLAARGIARTFQGVRLFKGLTALENVLVGRHARMRCDALRRLWPCGESDRSDRERAVQLLERLGVSGPDALAGGLGYGDQRRLEIARALAAHPRLLLLAEVEELRVRYGAVEAVHGVPFLANAGEVTALIGANGAGKSTTLAAISGLVPADGRIRFDGREIGGARPHAIVRAGIVQVPEGREILARMTVEENLLMGLRGRDRTEIASAYERFPILRERRALLAGSLSGGEQQMLAIARALLAQPRLLLLDEPSLGLAPMILKRVLDTLAELKRQGVTMLLVEQNALRALRLADRAYVMDLGRIVMRGTGPELLRDEGVARTYLGG